LSASEWDVKIANRWLLAALLTLGACWSSTALAQDLEPRRWTHLPTGLNFIGLGYGHTEGDVLFDPVLELEDVEYTMDSAIVSYVRSHGFFGKTARFDVMVAHHSGDWKGLLQGEPASTSRDGFGDPRLRWSILLLGAPAENRQEFAKSEKSNTIVGAAIAVTLPLGEYDDDLLINLGQNRWVIRPQMGVTHMFGKWAVELTGSVWFFTDNQDFFLDTTLESDPFYSLQAHLIHTFRPGLWASLSGGYGLGFQSTISGNKVDNESENFITALSVGLPINRKQGIKLAWFRLRTHADTGLDSDSLVAAYSVMF
jgi:hypothetical protein